jgi:hypothetical protein
VLVIGRLVRSCAVVPLLVEKSLALFAARSRIALPAPRVAAVFAMLPTATEDTANVQTASVAGIREEANPATTTGNQALSQSLTNCAAVVTATCAQDGIQRYLILLNMRNRLILLVPVLGKVENFFENDDKKTSDSVML